MSNTNSFTLRRACKPALYAAAALAGMAFAAPSRAQITQLASLSQLNSNKVTVTYPEAVLTPLSDPYTVTVGGAPTLTFTNNNTAANGNQFQRYDQQGLGAPASANFGGDFTPGTKLLRNAVTGSGAANAMTLTFSSPVNQLGFSYEPTLAGSQGDTNFTFLVFEGANFTTFTTPAAVRNRAGNGTPAFFGVNDAGGNLITSIQIFGIPVGNANGDDFVISPVTVSVAAVPEPGALALLAGAVVPIGLLAARRRRR